MASATILIVDDEDFVRDSLVDLLGSEGFRALAATNITEALEIVESLDVDAIATDLQMPGGDGLELLAKVRERGGTIPVVLLTGVGTVTDAVAAIKGGAYDFIQKPVEPEQFVLLMRRALEHRELVHEVDYLRHRVQDLVGPRAMVGESEALAAVRDLIAQVGPRDATVLVTGESGTGKELVAQEIHRLSQRCHKKIVRLNCAAVSETLFESEFFGHRRGAFTGAVEDRRGRFAEAEGGTIVLDEIATLSPSMQAKLLRILETGEYQVVGESRTRVADVRVIAITNEQLEERVKEGAFRQDLFYRLNIFPIETPPLRERKEDILLLAEHFLGRALATESIDLLCSYDWPGNVRELRNVLERASILAGRELPDAALFRRILAPPSRPEPAVDESTLELRQRIETLERRLIVEALSRSAGKKRQAAEMLGIDSRNLSYYLKKHGLGNDPAVGTASGS